jgi:hypothetical protein
MLQDRPFTLSFMTIDQNGKAGELAIGLVLRVELGIVRRSLPLLAFGG